jgi:hypothetical protein
LTIYSETDPWLSPHGPWPWFKSFRICCILKAMIRKLTEAECRFALEQGEFEVSLTSGPAAAITAPILSDCPW